MITIEYPFPDAKLFPNRSHGQHWSHTSKLRKEARKQAWALSMEKLGSNLLLANDVALSIVFVMPDRRRRDTDGLLSACKPTLDGLSDALHCDDYQFNPISIFRIYGPHACVRVSIEFSGVEI